MSKIIEISKSGNFAKLNSRFERLKGLINISELDKYGKEGVEALKASTPKLTGLTSESWYYTIERTDNGFEIIWKNRNVVNGLNIAMLLQYGHGTKNGGYVSGIDYINPALKPIFEEIARSAMEVIKR